MGDIGYRGRGCVTKVDWGRLRELRVWIRKRKRIWSDDGQTNGQTNRISTCRLDPCKGSSKKLLPRVQSKMSVKHVSRFVSGRTLYRGPEQRGRGWIFLPGSCQRFLKKIYFRAIFGTAENLHPKNVLINILARIKKWSCQAQEEFLVRINIYSG